MKGEALNLPRSSDSGEKVTALDPANSSCSVSRRVSVTVHAENTNQGFCWGVPKSHLCGGGRRVDLWGVTYSEQDPGERSRTRFGRADAAAKGVL